MNHSHSTQDHRNIPIANLDSLRPVDAPRDKISPFEIASGSSDDKHPEQQAPANSDPEKAVAVVEAPSPPRRRCSLRRRLWTVLVLLSKRPGFYPWLVSSGARLVFQWRVLTALSHHMEPLFGIDRELEAGALHDIFNRTEELGRQEIQCIQAGGEKCRDNYDLRHDIELSYIESIHSSNQAMLQQASEHSSQCIKRLYDTEEALRDLVLSGGTIPFVGNNNNLCSAEDRDAILAIAGGNVREDQNEIINVLRSFVKEGEVQTEYLKDLAIYNRDYFFGRLALLEADLIVQLGDLASVSLEGISLLKVTGLNGFDGVIACVSSQQDSSALCSIPSLSVSLEYIMANVEGYIEVSQETIRRAIMVIATLVERYDWAVGSIQDFVRVFQGLRNVLGRPFDLALDRLGGGIDLGQFVDIAPGAFYVPAGITDFPDFGDLPSIQPLLDDLEGEIEKIKDAVSQVADQVTDELKDKVDELVTNVRDAFAGVFEDYDPPRPPGFQSVDLDEISVVFAEKRKEVADQIAAEINKLGIDSVEFPESSTFVPPAVSVAFNATSAQVRDARAKLLPIVFPDIPKWVWKGIEFLVHKVYLLDIARIVWVAFHRLRKVWDMTAVPIPLVQMPTTAEKEAANKGTMGKIITVVTHDVWRKIGWCVLPVAAAAFALAMYYFLFGSYREGCVNSNDGTYIGRVLVSNYVSTPIVLDINRAQEVEVGKVEAHYQTICKNAQIATSMTQTQQIQQLSSIVNEYSKTVPDSSRLLGCIDFDAFGGLDESDLAACAIPLDVTLEEGVASCDWGECVIECDQAMVTEDIKRIVVESACIVEGQVHAKIWLYSLLVFIWVSLTLLFNAIEDCPPYLFPERCGSKTVKMELERYLETGKLLGAEGDEAQEAMDKAVASKYRWNKNKACVYVTFVLLMNVAWITMLVWLARSETWSQYQNHT